ncbi:protein-glutamate methylesterase/protein-glutamine glutaminase [methane-oxidizing endosymbiont of Gigantopelta aegis]|uniref:protein-glutamate methylesterase/protein-glutamine glutaminase n=1 Tax=methane-oxidizing endosymbiont of Gigantopelta aegis TaxID=2794938 RepID=UPI0018DC172C|nr:chemotaxis response regulator protein-glutamate methylesterase [methane-oxidizing endosymbiont of Gigantopelta aegis]
MTIRVLIVDDSKFMCHRIQQILEEEPDCQVVGIAENGMQAVRLAQELKPDVITMDVEMPVMDGITAVKKIMANTPTPILMFSAMTHVGAQATLDALNAGALDFLPKKLDDIDSDKALAKIILRRRVRMVAQQAERLHKRKRIITPQPKSAAAFKNRSGKFDLILIAASTGGPVAVQQILKHIPAHCSAPVLIIQHMPGSFTRSFAKRLDEVCKINVVQAEQGDLLKPGIAMVCPGGKQLEISQQFNRCQVMLRDKQAGEIYSPCVDLTFMSVAKNFTGKTLAIILTGMGTDGAKGAQQLKKQGAEIWAQDEASSVIYGMPKAIADAGLADNILNLEQIGQTFDRLN